ncbi:hypothetical protein J132_02960, partial [Termitomyces sp. J132]
DRTIDRLWEATVPFSTRELLDVAPGLREAMIQKLTLKSGTQSRDPNIPRVAAQQQTVREKKPPDKVDVNDLPMATYFIADGTQDDLPTGAVVHQDCVATYLENIPPGEKPVMVYVARDLQVLRSLNPIVNQRGQVETILDSGSQIVCMGKNVPFTFAEGFTIYLQVHIFVKPAYTVFLGHPFDTLMM